MITRTSLPTVAAVFASFILSGRNNVDGSTESCPTDARIDLKKLSGFIQEWGNNLSRNSTWREEDKTFDCPCGFETCVSLCVEDNENENSSPLPGNITFIHGNSSKENIPEATYHLFENDPCTVGWMAPYLEKNFTVFKNGSIHASDILSDFGEYCLLREPESGKYLAKVCRPWIRKGYYEIASVIIAIIVMVVIFTVYTILPELRNLHGLIFRSYIATYIGVYVFALVVMFTTESRTLGFWFNVAEITTRYFCASCAFWLNVMSFNIWRSFRSLRPIDFILRKEERRKFTWYAIYAWFGPIVLFGMAAALTYSNPHSRSDIVYKAFKQWASVGLVTISLVVNIVLHSSTALAIREQKKQTTDLVDGVNRHRDVDTQWFNLYLKLFVVMGSHIVVWVIWLVWATPVTLHLLATVEVVQSLLIFVIFLWKDNVRRSLYRQFGRAGKPELCFEQQLQAK